MMMTLIHAEKMMPTSAHKCEMSQCERHKSNISHDIKEGERKNMRSNK